MKDEFLEHLLAIIKSKKDENPEKSYTAMLQQSDVNETLKKIEEEEIKLKKDMDLPSFQATAELLTENLYNLSL